jgi:hypothetical protein
MVDAARPYWFQAPHFDLNASSAPVYCTGVKADIPNYRIHKLAHYVRFHCRDNPLKGDPPRPSIGASALQSSHINYPHLEISQWC